MGVHIVIEYDMPGHALSWKQANPLIVANCPVHRNSSVDPTKEITFEYIRAYLKDIIEAAFTSLNKDPLIHLGGDEVDHGCWNVDGTKAED